LNLQAGTKRAWRLKSERESDDLNLNGVDGCIDLMVRGRRHLPHSDDRKPHLTRNVHVDARAGGARVDQGQTGNGVWNLLALLKERRGHDRAERNGHSHNRTMQG